MKEISYKFKNIENCNMCGASSSKHKVLGKRLNSSQGKNPKSKIGITTTIVKCINCGLIFSSPLPIPDSIENHYGINPEDYWKEEYFQINNNYFTGVINEIIKYIKINRSSKALDIGAGLGKGIIALNRAGFDTYGIEPSKPFFDKAINKMGIKPDRLINKSIEEANYQECFFDFISFSAVLEHIYDPSEAIKKAIFWLKPEGIIRIEVPSSNWLISKIFNFYYKIKCVDYVTNLSPMHSPFHLYEFGLKSFILNGEKVGYEIAFHRYMVCSTYLPKIIDPIVKSIMKKTNTGMELAIWLRKK